MSVRVLHGDCRRVLRLMAARGVMVDSVACDPPYHLTSIIKRFSTTSIDGKGTNERRAKAGADGMARLSRGFMGKQWDGGDIAFDPETWELVWRVLKPGGHLVAFGGTRGWHRMAVAIEDAGFEIRDTVAWLYGTGFPKSHDVAKGIDKKKGTKGEVAPNGEPVRRIRPGADQNKDGSWEELTDRTYQPGEYTAGSPEAEQWQGWGTGLKPAFEPIVLARKPLSEKSIAANVLKHGTGAINVDGCRVETDENLNGGAYAEHGARVSMAGDEREGAALGMFQAGKTAGIDYSQPSGRWPANVVHDGSEEVEAAFAAYGENTSGRMKRSVGPYDGDSVTGFLRGNSGPNNQHGDSGTAARFFYSAKADKGDRLGSKHPTVKPVDLMRWLVRLITPPKGLVLDPFAGTGTTGQAAIAEGMRAVLIEREAEYVADIRKRVAHVRGDDTPLFKEPADG